MSSIKSKAENFLEYEKTNNRFLRELRENRELRNIKQLIVDNASQTMSGDQVVVATSTDCNNNGQIGAKNIVNEMTRSNDEDYNGDEIGGRTRSGSSASSTHSNGVPSEMMILCPHDQSVAMAIEQMTRRQLQSNFAPPSQARSLPPSSSSLSSSPVVSSLASLASISLVEFVQSHVAYSNPNNAQQFITLNGICGTFSDQGTELIILSGPIRGGDDALSFFKNPLALFNKEDSVFAEYERRHQNSGSADNSSIIGSDVENDSGESNNSNGVVAEKEVVNNRIQILRISEIDLDDTQVKLFLIAQPIEYEGCPWSFTMTPAVDAVNTAEKKKHKKMMVETKRMSHQTRSIRSNSIDRTFSPSRSFWSLFMGTTPSTPTPTIRNSISSVATSTTQATVGQVDEEDDHLSDDEEEGAEESEFHEDDGHMEDDSHNKASKGDGDDTQSDGKDGTGHEKTSGSKSDKLSHITKLINMHKIPSTTLFEPARRPRSRSNSGANESQQPRKRLVFQDFVNKMKHRSAVPLVRKIKSFIDEINAESYSDDVPQKVLSFLNNLMVDIRTHPQWKNASEVEIDNARESLEKYVMTKIYRRVFSPDVEDLQKDNNIATRLSQFRSLSAEKLEVDQRVVDDPSWEMAIEELKKINRYKAPRDKMICISNCCKILFSILERADPNGPVSADTFLPALIYLVLKANPPHMHSNVKYIMDFRNPDKLVSETAYFLTNMQSTVLFWENVDHTSLSMDKDEFDRITGAKSSLLFEDDFDEERIVEEEPVSATAVAAAAAAAAAKAASTANHDSIEASKDDVRHDNRNGEAEEPMSETNEPSPDRRVTSDEQVESSIDDTTSSASSPEQTETDTMDHDTVSAHPPLVDKDVQTTSSTSPSDKDDNTPDRRKIVAEFMSEIEHRWQHSHGSVSDKFVNMDAASLRIGDVDELLRQYQILHEFHAKVLQQYSEMQLGSVLTLQEMNDEDQFKE